MFQTNFSFVLSADVLCCSLFSGRLTFAVIRPELYGSEISSIDATNAASRALHLRRPASLVPTNLASSVRANGKMRFQQYRGASGQKLKQTKPSISSPKTEATICRFQGPTFVQPSFVGPTGVATNSVPGQSVCTTSEGQVFPKRKFGRHCILLGSFCYLASHTARS